jgi:hypothetical protein
MKVTNELWNTYNELLELPILNMLLDLSPGDRVAWRQLWE